MITLLICRYREDLSWVKQFYLSDKVNIIIYNKGEKLLEQEGFTPSRIVCDATCGKRGNVTFPCVPAESPPSGGDLNQQRCNEIILDNVGREGHAYYKYIYDNYDNLSETTIFLQGNPFDHSPNLIKNLNKYIDTPTKISFNFLSEWIIKCNLSGCIHHEGLPMRRVYEELFGIRKDDMSFEFGAGAQFIVSREQILKRPRSFYLKIVNMLGKENCPVEGFVIERFHKLIFASEE
jgi:hypothetical protein